jgi:deoxyribodipyrimidine photo-lyase
VNGQTGVDLKTLFIFRRDLRLADNTGLREALRTSDEVIPCFILDPRQTDSHAYRSEFAFQFMIESLNDLDAQLREFGSRLFVFSGDPAQVVERLFEKGISAVHVNRDYTPFSKLRDARIKAVCDRYAVPFMVSRDALLFEPEDVRRMYKVYSAFRRFTLGLPRRAPQKKGEQNFYRGAMKGLPVVELTALSHPNSTRWVKGGRTEGLKQLSRIRRLQSYADTRDIPAAEGTSFLSAHHKFGTVSIRETASVADRVFGENSVFYGELLWRDFFTHVAFHRPDVFGDEFNGKYKGLSWRGDGELFDRWCRGETGFPIVDAGMRQLNSTGYMHNRVRMIVASFLTKDLRVDWRLGERYFASRLIDYDPCVNNGNWQWAASTGCDAQPYFRIFNPWRQQQRFDPRCEYIQQWVPELANVNAKDIHGVEKNGQLKGSTYPSPMVNHKDEAALSLKMFKHLRTG